jgi:pantoate--beta-alanine ligase
VSLRLIRTASEFAAATDAARAGGLAVGLVPTMGALHAGHRSLVERASGECGFVAVTIFVNPLQFDDPADLDAYPRDLEADLALLGGAGADVVFAPEVSEIYPDFPQISGTTVHTEGLTSMLEGKFRRGHFDGVATVVTKLFCIAWRCRAYFGEKDFQQVAVVRRVVRDLCLPIEVVACPTVRELDGLAVSSRNVRLSNSERATAAVLHEALVAGATAISSGEDRPSEVRKIMLEVLSASQGVDPEYVEVVDPGDLTTPERLSGEVRLLIAARVGPVRLIDNLGALVGSRFGRDLQIFPVSNVAASDTAASYTDASYVDTSYAEQKEH